MYARNVSSRSNVQRRKERRQRERAREKKKKGKVNNSWALEINIISLWLLETEEEKRTQKVSINSQTIL